MLTNPCKHKKENSKDQSKIENRKTEVLRKKKSWFFKKSNKIGKPPASITIKKEERE